MGDPTIEVRVPEVEWKPATVGKCGGWACELYGETLEVMNSGNGSPPDRIGGQSTNVSSSWWRYAGGKWHRLSQLRPVRGPFSLRELALVGVVTAVHVGLLDLAVED